MNTLIMREIATAAGIPPICTYQFHVDTSKHDGEASALGLDLAARISSRCPEYVKREVMVREAVGLAAPLVVKLGPDGLPLFVMAVDIPEGDDALSVFIHGKTELNDMVEIQDRLWPAYKLRLVRSSEDYLDEETESILGLAFEELKRFPDGVQVALTPREVALEVLGIVGMTMETFDKETMADYLRESEAEFLIWRICSELRWKRAIHAERIYDKSRDHYTSLLHAHGQAPESEEGA